MRVMGSHDISTSFEVGGGGEKWLGMGVSPARIRQRPESAVGVAGGCELPPFFVCRHSGSRLSEARVKLRNARTVFPYITTAVVESCAPGGSSRNGMNLSGKPGIVQPMHTPPTFGQPPMPFIQPRLP